MLGLLSTPPITAQPVEPRFERISVEEGLSHSAVRAIHQDARGFMWFGTQEGLNRYDGYTFKVFKNHPDDPSSLSESRVTALYEDSRDVLWVGTWGGGLDRFRGADESFAIYRHDPHDEGSLSHDTVRCIREDGAGTLWIGTDDGLNRYQRQDDSFRRYRHDPAAAASLAGRSVAALYVDGAGELWVGTDQGLDRLDRRAETFVHYLPGNVTAIQEDRDGRLWIASRTGLDRLDRATGSVTHYRHDAADPSSLSEDQVLSLHLDRSGELWIGTASRGLDRLADSTGTFVHERTDPFDPESLSDGSILSIYEDRTGILWFGTYVGVNKYDRFRERFVTCRQRPGRDPTLSSNSIWAIREDRSGVLWVGTYDNGLDAMDRARHAITHYQPDPSAPGSLKNGEINALYEDRQGELWVGTWGGLARLDRRRARFSHYLYDPEDPYGLSNDRVNALYEDGTGRLWVGTLRGLDRYDRAHDRFVRGGPPVSISAIVEDRAGSLWLGSHSDGLFRRDRGSERDVQYRHAADDPDSLSGNSVATLYEDRSGVLWIGTFGAGLNRREPEHDRFIRYREENGLPNDTVLCMLEDDKGNLWLSTNNGLSRLDPRSETFYNYNVDDGLQGRVFSVGSCFRSARGEMFFGGIHGFNAFYPERIASDSHAPPIVITDFRLFNQTPPLKAVDPDSPLEKSILETGELTLSRRDYVFTFEFAALHYASPRHNQYAYRLEGFDRDWIATDATKRFAQYSNLAPGSYVFRVKGANNDGVWNEQGTAIRIVVQPPPWKTWWAQALYVFLTSATVLIVVRSVQRQVERERAINRRLRETDRLKDELLEQGKAQIAERERLIAELGEKNAELERFTYTVSHDLKSPLFTIKGFLGLVKKDMAAGDDERVERDLHRISAATDTMQRLLEELLEFSRIGRVVNPSETVSLFQVAHEAVDLVEELLRERGAEVVIRPELPAVFGDRDRLREVFQNLLDNAVRFMGDQQDPYVEVGVRRDQGQDLICYVRDNGIGIGAPYHEKVFGLFERLNAEDSGTGIGLALVKRIVEHHGGRIWVESAGPGHGSTFCFTLPRPERHRPPSS